MGYSYKRLRFIPLKKPNQELYERKKQLIQKYDLLSQRGKIDLYFFDESKSYMSETSVKSDKVVEVFDDFSSQLSKPTVVVLDNASFHKSKVLP